MSCFSTVLGFDTSHKYCGTAVFHNGDVVAAHYVDMERGQAESLFPMIEETLKDAGLGYDALDAIGVGVGPGNFTGIRISVSAARGLGLSLGIPAIGVNLFDALACDAPDGPLLLTLNAPKDQVYIQRRNGGHAEQIEIVDLDDLPRVPPDTCVIGQSSSDIAERLGCRFAPAAFAPASAIARVAATRKGGPTERPVPLYMRPADAAPSSTPPPVILP